MYTPIWGKRKKMSYWQFVVINGITRPIIIDIALIIVFSLPSNNRSLDDLINPWWAFTIMNAILFLFDAFLAHRYWIKNYRQSPNNLT